MAYRSQQRPMAPTQARAARLQVQQQQKMLRVTGGLVGATLLVASLVTLLQSWL
ncbi:MAG: hypothetical protein QM742_13395 [Aquabacterium sp.]